MFGSLVLKVLLSAQAFAAAPEYRILFLGHGLTNPRLEAEKQPLAVLERKLNDADPSRRTLVLSLSEESLAVQANQRFQEIRDLKPHRVIFWRPTAALPLEILKSLHFKIDWNEHTISPEPVSYLPQNFREKLVHWFFFIPIEQRNAIISYLRAFDEIPDERLNFRLERMTAPLNHQTKMLDDNVRGYLKVPLEIFISPNEFYSTSGLFEDSWVSRRLARAVVPRYRFRSRLIRNVLERYPLDQRFMPIEAKTLYTSPYLEGGSEYILNEKGAELWAEIIVRQLDESFYPR